MERASSLIYPGGRTLVGWWRQLASYKPTELFVGHVFVHRIEALVNIQAEQSIDALSHLVLQAVDLEATSSPGNLAGVSLACLQERLRLPLPALQRVLAGLCAEGLLARQALDRWQISELGDGALERQSFPVRRTTRRVFPFVERLNSSASRLGEPHFFPLAECANSSWQVDSEHTFPLATLRDSITQSQEWKRLHAFPTDVESLADDSAGEPWQQVVVDRPERVMLALAASGGEIVGFAGKADGWTLYDKTPMLRIASASATQWPDIAQIPDAEIWREAWRSWCRQKQLPASEVELCSVSYQPPQLQIQPPQRLMQRLQAAKSDLFKGEVWLLVGDGYLRRAVQLSVRSLA